jgi:hypothetical protein
MKQKPDEWLTNRPGNMTEDEAHVMKAVNERDEYYVHHLTSDEAWSLIPSLAQKGYMLTLNEEFEKEEVAD